MLRPPAEISGGFSGARRAQGGARCEDEEQEEEERALRAARMKERQFAITMFPRCPIKLTRKKLRKTLLQEPWTAANAGGCSECRGTVETWHEFHDLVLMGFSIRTPRWRYVAWVIQLEPSLSSDQDGHTGSSSRSNSGSGSRSRNVWNWTYPPVAQELYPHVPSDSLVVAASRKPPPAPSRGSGRGPSGEDLRVVATGTGAFDAVEDRSVAADFPGLCALLFAAMRGAVLG